MASKHLFLKRPALIYRLFKWGTPLLLLVILWPSKYSNVADATNTWTAPIEPPGAVVVSENKQPLPPTSGQVLSEAVLTTGADTRKENKAKTTVRPDQGSSSAVISPTSYITSPTQGLHSESALRSALQQWLLAWEARDLHTYLSFYGINFEPADGISQQRWVDLRKDRITSKKKIELKLQNLSVQMQGNTANINFTQIYADERLRMTDRKTMVWQYDGKRWLIQREITR